MLMTIALLVICLLALTALVGDAHIMKRSPPPLCYRCNDPATHRWSTNDGTFYTCRTCRPPDHN